MGSTFSGLNIAMNGLYSSQQSLYVIQNNISNANTPGYSREVVVQKAATPQFSQVGAGMIGTGSQVVSVERARDDYLDSKYRYESSMLGECDVKSDFLSQVEHIMGGTAEYGYNTALNEFYSALEDIAVNPDDMAGRTVVEKKGEALCEYFNSSASDLIELQQEINSSVNIKVDEVNSLTSQIADLNGQIYMAQLSNDRANELKDKRDLLVDELSKIMDIEVSQVVTGTLPNGEDDVSFQIKIGGTCIVKQSDSYELECYMPESSEGAKGMYEIRFKESKETVEITGGELKGYMDIRDGEGEDSQYCGIPYYMARLDECAQVFAKAFNEGVFSDGSHCYEGHSGGEGLEGSTGVRFFTCGDMTSYELVNGGEDLDSAYGQITALNISVSADVQNDVNKIAASSVGGGSGNNETIIGLIDICSDGDMFSQGSFEDFLNSIVSKLGMQKQSSDRLFESQGDVVSYIENKRLSVSSVSIDEETVSLVRAQQAYEAAAKMIEVWKQIYDITIEELGD